MQGEPEYTGKRCQLEATGDPQRPGGMSQASHPCIQFLVWDWKPLTVVATAAASLCRRRVVLNWPFAGGPSWQWTGEKGMRTRGREEEEGVYGRMKDNQTKEKGSFNCNWLFFKKKCLSIETGQRDIYATRTALYAHCRPLKYCEFTSWIWSLPPKETESYELAHSRGACDSKVKWTCTPLLKWWWYVVLNQKASSKR